MPLEPGTAVLFSLDDGVGFDRKKIKVMLGDIELNIIFFPQELVWCVQF